MKKNHEFIMYVGPMWGSKTTTMLSKLERLELQNKSVVTFKPAIDNRYDDADIVTHSGWKRKAHCIVTGLDILRYIEKMSDVPDVVAVDEAFMINDCAKSLIWLFQKGVTILVSSLDLSFKCKPFKEVAAMMPWATNIVKCPAICNICGEDAFYTYRKSLTDDEIMIGGKEAYDPRCFNHHPIINKMPGNYE